MHLSIEEEEHWVWLAEAACDEVVLVHPDLGGARADPSQNLGA